jgi:opacity protein-like surface antigen
MVLRRTLFFLLCFIQVHTANAQASAGLEAGLTGGYLHTNISNRESTTIRYRLGYAIAVPFEYKLSDWFSITTDPGIIQKNYTLARTDSLSGAYTVFSNTYLQVPLMAKFVYGNKLKLFADIGMFYGYWLSAREGGQTPDIFSATETSNGSGQTTSTISFVKFNQQHPLNPQIDRRSEWGWIAGAGVQKQVNQQWLVYASLRLYESLTQQQKQYMTNQIPQYNEVIGLAAGALFLLK